MKTIVEKSVKSILAVSLMFCLISLSSCGSKPQQKCGYCGKSFNKGEGYNTLMRIINTPDQEHSHYCSRKCAEDFLRNN